MGVFLLFAVLLSVFVPNNIKIKANPNSAVESIVKASFTDMPAMIDIAKCESNFRQFNADGTPLKGGAGKKYVGIFQIDEALHSSRANSMAYDINTIEGNIAYARYMYFASGTNPWKSCVSSTPNPNPTPQTPSSIANSTLSLNENLSFGMTSASVKILQTKLNQTGFTVASQGVGSQGFETTYFGELTRQAVRKFQCEKGIVCSGTEATTGFGRVGPKTRNALNSL